MPWVADLPLLGAPHRLPRLAHGIARFGIDYDRREPEPNLPSAAWFELSDGALLGLATAEHGDHFALAVGTRDELAALGVAPPGPKIEWRAWTLGALSPGVFMALCVDTQPDDTGAIIVRVGVRAMAKRGETLRSTEHPHYVGDGVVFAAADGRRLVFTSAPWGRINVLEEPGPIDEALDLGRLWPLDDYLATYHSNGDNAP